MIDLLLDVPEGVENLDASPIRDGVFLKAPLGLARVRVLPVDFNR
jgi:hypothetical protein